VHRDVLDLQRALSGTVTAGEGEGGTLTMLMAGGCLLKRWSPEARAREGKTGCECSSSQATNRTEQRNEKNARQIAAAHDCNPIRTLKNHKAVNSFSNYGTHHRPAVCTSSVWSLVFVPPAVVSAERQLLQTFPPAPWPHRTILASTGRALRLFAASLQMSFRTVAVLHLLASVSVAGGKA